MLTLFKVLLRCHECLFIRPLQVCDMCVESLGSLVSYVWPHYATENKQSHASPSLQTQLRWPSNHVPSTADPINICIMWVHSILLLWLHQSYRRRDPVIHSLHLLDEFDLCFSPTLPTTDWNCLLLVTDFPPLSVNSKMITTRGIPCWTLAAGFLFIGVEFNPQRYVNNQLASVVERLDNRLSSG